MSEQQTFVDPVNYFEGDRVRVTADPLMKSQVWVGRTGTVTKGSGRRWNEGINVKLDRPVGQYETLWFRHSEIEFEDNRQGLPMAVYVGDYVKTMGSPMSCDKPFGNVDYSPWMRSREQVADLNKAGYLEVECTGCRWKDRVNSYEIERVSFMCDQPAEPDGSYHADLIP